MAEASAIEEAGWTDAVVTGAQPASARTTIPGIAAAVRWHITILDPFGSLAERLPHANDIATDGMLPGAIIASASIVLLNETALHLIKIQLLLV